VAVVAGRNGKARGAISQLTVIMSPRCNGMAPELICKVTSEPEAGGAAEAARSG